MLTRTLLLSLALIVTCAFAQTKKPVFACNMGAMTAEQRTELSGAIHRLIDAKPQTKELANGYEMRFDHAGDHFVDATTWIRYERLCCPFFNFSMSLTNNDGPLVIRLTGPKGVKEFIGEDLPGLKAMTHSG